MCSCQACTFHIFANRLPELAVTMYPLSLRLSTSTALSWYLLDRRYLKKGRRKKIKVVFLGVRTTSRGPPPQHPGSCGLTTNYWSKIEHFSKYPSKIIKCLYNRKSAYLWQLLDRCRTQRLKSFFLCFYTFWRLLDLMEANTKKCCFLNKSCGPAQDPHHPGFGAHHQILALFLTSPLMDYYLNHWATDLLTDSLTLHWGCHGMLRSYKVQRTWNAIFS